jgi:hypothetical protein
VAEYMADLGEEGMAPNANNPVGLFLLVLGAASIFALCRAKCGHYHEATSLAYSSKASCTLIPTSPPTYATNLPSAQSREPTNERWLGCWMIGKGSSQLLQLKQQSREILLVLLDQPQLVVNLPLLGGSHYGQTRQAISVGNCNLRA